MASNLDIEEGSGASGRRGLTGAGGHDDGLAGEDMRMSTHWTAEEVDALAKRRAAEDLPDGDLDAMALCFNLFRVANRIQQDLETRVHRPAGISWAAFRILFTVRYASSITPLELARLSSVSQASISSVLNTLERYGMVVRERAESDGRMIYVRLTPAGERNLAELLARNNAREQGWAAALTPTEQRRMLALLHKLLAFHIPEPDDPERLASRLPHELNGKD